MHTETETETETEIEMKCERERERRNSRDGVIQKSFASYAEQLMMLLLYCCTVYSSLNTAENESA